MSHSVLQSAQAALNVKLRHAGDLSLLDGPRRMLLVSRTPRYPAPDTAWVVSTIAAARQAAAANEVLVSGVQRLPFDLSLWLTQDAAGAAVVALERSPEQDADWHAWLPTRHLLVWPEQPLQHNQAPRQRDLLLTHLADRAYAIHVRPDGNMAEAARLLRQRDCPVEPWSQPSAPPSTAPAAIAKAPATDVLPPPEPWEYLTHYTREPDGAWPGEPYGDYLRWLSSGTPFTPRNGFGTLCRILRERQLRACGRMISGSAPMVCFTALPPQQALTLRRWRRGLARWTFAQYGLAIRQSVLTGLGAQAVHYVSRQVMNDAAQHERPYLQIESSEALDWTLEAEWRMPSNLDLSQLATRDLLAVVSTPLEAESIQKEFSIQACRPG